MSAAAAARSGGGVADDGMGSGGIGGGVTAPPPLGSTAAGGDDPARRGDGGAHDGSMGSGGVGRGVAATRTLGFGAAGGDGPDFQGGGAGHVGVVQAQLEPVPGGSIPEEHIGKDPSPGSSLLFLHARAACTDNDKLVTLRDDLAEHVYGQYGEYLARHLERCVTWTWRPIYKELWERGTASTTWNAFSSLRFFFSRTLFFLRLLLVRAATDEKSGASATSRTGHLRDSGCDFPGCYCHACRCCAGRPARERWVATDQLSIGRLKGGRRHPPPQQLIPLNEFLTRAVTEW